MPSPMLTKLNKSIMNCILVIMLSIVILPTISFAQEDNGNENDNDTVIDITGLGGDFTLHGKDGRVSLSDFRGKVVAMYFGYTKCPDICPTSLSILSHAIAQLTPEEKKNFQSIFISFDPERDTPSVLAEYVAFFDEEMIGLSAAPMDLNPVVAQYGAYYEKVPYSNSELIYGIDHTSATYIIGKDGKLTEILPHSSKSERVLESIRKAMEQ